MEIKNYFKKILSGDNENNKIIRNLLLMGVLGVVFLLAGNIFNTAAPDRDLDRKVETSNQKSPVQQGYRKQITGELENSLSVIQGVGKVKVQLLLSQGTSYQYEYNQNRVNKITSETDQNGGKRKIEEDNIDQEVVIIKKADGGEEALVKVEKKPEIKSVIVVAQGADDSQLKYDIYQAVSDFLDIPVHKINVLPYQRR